MKIYVASSWRNVYQPRVVELLRYKGYSVYDFKNSGFQWTEIDPEWKNWSPGVYREALKHPIAKKGYNLDMEALRNADICVLVLPAGRSASWEAGYHFGRTGTSTVLYMPEPCEPELMYREAMIAINEGELIGLVKELVHRLGERLDSEFPLL